MQFVRSLLFLIENKLNVYLTKWYSMVWSFSLCLSVFKWLGFVFPWLQLLAIGNLFEIITETNLPFNRIIEPAKGRYAEYMMMWTSSLDIFNIFSR